MNKQMEFKKWQKIGQFHNTRKSINAIVDYKQSVGETIGFPVVSYKGKIKLDGTNAAIRVAGGQVAAQSRSRLISVEDDNYGFAVFVTGLEDWALRVAGKANEITIYGEWCGQGIEALERIKQVEFDLVVSDLSMPRMGGVRLAETIRMQGGVMPIIFMTGYAGSDESELSIGTMVLQKPFTPEELITATSETIAETNAKPQIAHQLVD